MNKKYSTFAPCRLDFAGGTLDIPPICFMLPEPCTVNLAIDIGVEIEVELTDQAYSQVLIDDYGLGFRLQKEGPNSVPDGGALLASILDYFHLHTGRSVNIRTKSYSPANAGLAASSTVCVAATSTLLKAFEMELSQAQIIQLCLDLEARVLGTPAGYQDFFSALNGGLQLISYEPGNISAQSIQTDLEELQSHLTLVFTGKPHHSGLTNWEVVKRFIEGDKVVRSALAEIGSLAKQLSIAFKQQQWQEAGAIIGAEWQQRKQISPVVSTPMIDSLIETVAKVGGSGKVCGAGGGGCVLLWTDTEAEKQNLAKELEDFPVDILPWKANSSGCKITEIS
jgi:D-glycero-alpha-D-manno-heptose-7-phosphate kinase